jgi:hypothetical protein
MTAFTRRSCIVAFLTCCALQEVAASSSSFGYDLILTIVIVEVVFSFLIGGVCIILSFNLFRALKDSPDGYTRLPVGEFPLSRGAGLNALGNQNDVERGSESGRGATSNNPSPVPGDNQLDYSTFRDPRMTHGSFGSDAEMDFEEIVDGGTGPPRSSMVAVVRSVAGYLRLW